MLDPRRTPRIQPATDSERRRLIRRAVEWLETVSDAHAALTPQEQLEWQAVDFLDG